MPITKLTSGEAVVTAYNAFLRALPGDAKYNGHRQIAANIMNGMPMLYQIVTKKGTEFYQMTDDNANVTGLLRLEIRETDVHIDNVVALSGTFHLVLFAKERAKESGKSKAHLHAADESLPGYYKKFGFDMVTKGAKSGEMEALIV